MTWWMWYALGLLTPFLVGLLLYLGVVVGVACRLSSPTIAGRKP